MKGESPEKRGREELKRREKEATRFTKKYLKTLSLEEKIGQLFLVTLDADRISSSGSASSQSKNLSPEMGRWLKKNAIGGVVLFRRDLESLAQIKRLTSDLQKSFLLPGFIGIDEEGGVVSRLKGLADSSIYKMPSALSLSKRGEEATYEAYTKTANQLRGLGINLDFAPVADLGGSLVIGTRAFGTDPKEVSRYVVQAILGLQDNGVLSVVKHFPGHGNSQVDPHDGFPQITTTLKELERDEFNPFFSAIKKGNVGGVMSAHIKTPQIKQTKGKAATLTPLFYRILKKRWRFKGVVITDALDMAAIAGEFSAAEAAYQAFIAGADILLMPNRPEEALVGMIEAYHEGKISKKRLDDSVFRILRAKYLFGILSP